MRSIAALLTLSVALSPVALAACGDDDDARPAPPRRQAREVPETPPPVYDASGRLLPSGETFSAIELPRGLTLLREDDRVRVYRTDVPVRDVQTYFGPRLNTPEVEQIGEGVVYHGATVRSETGQTLHVTVSILPSAAGTRVELRRHPLPAAQPMTEADYREALERDMQRWD